MKKGTKTSGENKSQVIRDYAKANPTLGPTKIANDLKAQGIDAYPALVSQALRSLEGRPAGTKKKAEKKRGRPVKATTNARTNAASANGVDYVSVLKNSAEFVKQCGGVDEALSAIKTFQKVSSLLKD